jgi:glutaredoxin
MTENALHLGLPALLKPKFGNSSIDVILYSRKQCHLCDQALQTLDEHGLTPSLVDIDSNEQLRNQFDTCVPVVEINGQIRFRGRVDPVLLRRIMRSERL